MGALYSTGNTSGIARVSAHQHNRYPVRMNEFVEAKVKVGLVMHRNRSQIIRKNVPREKSSPGYRSDRIYAFLARVGRTIHAAHDDFVDQLAVRHVESAIKKGFFLLLPVKIEHPPQQFLEQGSVWDTALDSDSDRQSVDSGTGECSRLEQDSEL